MTLTFDDATRAARRSQLKKFKTGAAVYDSKGKLLSIGWSHPSLMYVTTPRSMHAEHHALRNIPTGSIPHTVVIVTLNRHGNFGKGDPCKSCASLLDKYNVQVVIASQRKED